MEKIAESKIIPLGKSSLGIVIPKVYVNDHNIKKQSVVVVERGLSKEDLYRLEENKLDCLIIYPK
jgi:hypothetical protein